MQLLTTMVRFSDDEEENRARAKEAVALTRRLVVDMRGMTHAPSVKFYDHGEDLTYLKDHRFAIVARPEQTIGSRLHRRQHGLNVTYHSCIRTALAWVLGEQRADFDLDLLMGRIALEQHDEEASTDGNRGGPACRPVG